MSDEAIAVSALKFFSYCITVPILQPKLLFCSQLLFSSTVLKKEAEVLDVLFEHNLAASSYIDCCRRRGNCGSG